MFEVITLRDTLPRFQNHGVRDHEFKPSRGEFRDFNIQDPSLKFLN